MTTDTRPILWGNIAPALLQWTGDRRSADNQAARQTLVRLRLAEFAAADYLPPDLMQELTAAVDSVVDVLRGGHDHRRHPGRNADLPDHLPQRAGLRLGLRAAGGVQPARAGVDMNRPIDILPPLTCGACGALVDDRQAWHRWPHHTPDASGDYLVALQLPDTTVYTDIARWDGAERTWSLLGDLYGVDECVPLAWRHRPALPEWLQ